MASATWIRRRSCRTTATASRVLQSMRRCTIVVASVLVAGCHQQNRVASRVKLPEGLPTYDGSPRPRTPDLMPPAPRIDRQPAPASADDVVKLASATVRPDQPHVEGVCRYDGADAACWDTRGAPYTQLSSRVKARLSSGGMGRPSPSWSATRTGWSSRGYRASNQKTVSRRRLNS